MISVYRNNNVITKGNEREIQLRGLSTDEKPTKNVENGTIFIEIDTGDIYIYDLTNKEWNNITSGE